MFPTSCCMIKWKIFLKLMIYNTMRGDDVMAYYPRLRDLREDNDLTQNQVVQDLQIHKTTYTNYEQGKREIPLNLAIQLSKYYNVSLDYIAGLTNEKRPLYSDVKLKRLRREKKIDWVQAGKGGVKS